MSEDLLALAEKSAETDLAFLRKAKEEAKKRMKDNPSPDNISAFNKARDVVDTETARLPATTPGRAFKTQLDAVAFLRDRGFKVSKSALSRDLKADKISTDVNGHFEESSLLAYALALKEPVATVENRALSSATTEKISADAELKSVQAARYKLKLEKELGLLMPRAEHERDLAARALFFKKEVENFIHLYGPGIIHLVGGDENRMPDLAAFWEEKTADWMHAWSEEQEFVVDDEDMDADADQPGEGESDQT
jgi:hypothetical protein